MSNKIQILTHRGLEPDNSNFYPESSYESFENHLEKGFGIEFDVCFAKNGIVISHDSNLRRITNKKDKRNFEDITLEEIKKIKYGNEQEGRISDFNELMNLIRENNSNLNAMHIKGKYQNKQFLDLLINNLKRHKDILDKILIFDLKPEVARVIKSIFPNLQLALSVSHDYDIKRYNASTNETLFSVGEAIQFKKQELFDWAWLDEWDLVDENNKTKKLYTMEVFERLRNLNYKIALVTPELHGTSPGLLGGESHQDAKNKESLFKRIKEIISLKPDAICTDYPKEIGNLIN